MSLIRNSVKCARKLSNAATRCLSSKANPTTIVAAGSEVLDEEKINILAPQSGKKIDLSTFAPELVPTFNFAAYVNISPTLQKWLQLGVDLSKFEKKPGIPEYIMGLDFETHMKSHIQ